MIYEAARALGGLTCILCLSLAACSDATGPERKPRVQLLLRSTTIAVGDTFQASLLPMLPPGYVPPVDWVSANPVVAGVARTGTLTARVTGLQPGEAVIHVSGEGEQDSLHVTVITSQPAP